MHESSAKQSSALLALLRHFKWREVALLTSSTEYGMNGLRDFTTYEFISKVSIVTFQHFKVFSNSTPIDVTSELAAIRVTFVKVVILHCESRYATAVLEQAQAKGMMERGWAWIVTEAITSVDGLYTTRHPPLYMQGLIGLRPTLLKNKNSEFYSEFIKKWGARTVDRDLETYAYNVFDAVLTFAVAAHNLLSEGKKLPDSNTSCACSGPPIQKENGKELHNYIRKVETHGITGLINFTKEGLRVPECYDIVNIHSRGYMKVGLWGDSLGVRINNPKDLYWIGGFQTVPSDTIVDISNMTFEITTVLEPAFMMLTNETASGFEGYLVDVIDVMSKNLGFKYRIHISYDGQYGVQNSKTQQWDGMIGEILNKKSHISVSAIFITSERESVVSFTQPYMHSGLGILMMKPQVKSSLLSFMDPYSNPVWVMLLISTILVGFVVNFCNKLSPFDYYGRWVQAPETCEPEDLLQREEEKHKMSLKDFIFCSIAFILAQGFDILPRSSSGRVVICVWWMVSVLFVSHYTANLVSFLTVDQRDRAIESFDDLTRQETVHYGTVANTMIAYKFMTSTIPVYRRAWQHMVKHDTNVKDTVEAVRKIDTEEIPYAFIYDAPIVEYLAQQKPCDKTMVGDVFTQLNYGIALEKNSPFVAEFDSEITRMKESGIMEVLKKRWFYDKADCSGIHTATGVQRIEVFDVAGIFVVFFGGLFLSIMSLVAEILHAAWVECKEDDQHDLYSWRQAVKRRFRRMRSDIRRNWFTWTQ